MLPNMIVTPPPGFVSDMRKAQDGSDAFVIDHAENSEGTGITLMPNSELVLSVSGLPAPPSWTRWAGAADPRHHRRRDDARGPRLRALRRRHADPARGKRREKLMAELVEIERTGVNKDKRESDRLAELERLWVDD